MEYPLRDGKGTKSKSFKEFILKDGLHIGIFQGSFGQNPDLDIIIKYQDKGMRVPRTPRHIHWSADLLIKKALNKKLTKEFVEYLLSIWDKVKPFENKEEQQRCELHFSEPEQLKKFEELDYYGEYSVEFIAKVLELLMLEEKTGNKKAFMFKKVLTGILEDKPIHTVMGGAGFGGKKSK